MNGVYYNENDRYTAQWLRNLIEAGLLPSGTIDDRDIRKVVGDDVQGFREQHWFGGIGGWSLAIRLAGWPAGREVWTGSCPCQPYSSAGKRKGAADERALWPELLRLVAERRPATLFGEQTASALGREWLDGVRVDLEALGYAVGAADLCASCLGAPHIRQRLFWVADAGRDRWDQQCRDTRGKNGAGKPQRLEPLDRSNADRMADPQEQRRGQGDPVAGRRDIGVRAEGDRCGPADDPHLGGLGNAIGPGPQGRRAGVRARPDDRPDGKPPGSPGGLPDRVDDRGLDFWSAFDLIPCRDGKARRAQSGLECLVDGVPFRLADGRTLQGASRPGLLRGFGNAIVPQLAAVFVRAFLETEP
jgi:DNA (cytosine-5)-methyltransferase 1